MSDPMSDPMSDACSKTQCLMHAQRNSTLMLESLVNVIDTYNLLWGRSERHNCLEVHMKSFLKFLFKLLSYSLLQLIAAPNVASSIRVILPL